MLVLGVRSHNANRFGVQFYATRRKRFSYMQAKSEPIIIDVSNFPTPKSFPSLAISATAPIFDLHEGNTSCLTRNEIVHFVVAPSFSLQGLTYIQILSITCFPAK